MTIRTVVQNAGWKLLALVLAFALWVVFVKSPELDVSILAPLEFQNAPADLEMNTDSPERIYLQVKGVSARLQNLDQAHPAVILDLAVVQRPGEYTFTVEQHNIKLPYGLQLVRPVPGQVRLRFENRVTADVPVHVRQSAGPPDGYRVAHEQVLPARVRIVGPESRVRRVGYVETDPIDLSHSTGKAQFRVQTYVPDSQVRLQSAQPVDVTLAIARVP